MKKDIVLIGGGGHCKACIDVIEQTEDFQIIGIVDMPEKINQKVLGYEIFATDRDLQHLAKKFSYFLITVGQIKSPQTRVSLFDELNNRGAKFPVIISLSAYVSPHARIGEGSIIMHHALVNAGAKIGRNCIINSRALIEHDATIADHCHIATGAIVNGGVRIGPRTFIGSNSVIREYIKIGEDCVIGTGDKITTNITSGMTIKTSVK